MTCRWPQVTATKLDSQRLVQSNNTVQKPLNNGRTLFMQQERSPHAGEEVTFSLLIMYNIDSQVLHDGRFTNLKKRRIQILRAQWENVKSRGLKNRSPFLSLLLLLISVVTSVPTFQHHFQSTYTILHLLAGLFNCQG
jgi:hypothetical protein